MTAKRTRKARIWGALAALLALGLVAPAGADVGTEVGELRAAATGRVAAIGPAPTDRAQKREAKKLTKADTILSAYQGANDVADVRRLGKAGKQVVKSRTQDAVVLAELGDLLQALAALAQTQKGLAADAAAVLSDPNLRAKVDKVMQKAEAKLGAGLALIDTNPTKAHALIVAGWKLYDKALAKATKLALRNTGGKVVDGPPPGISIYQQSGIGGLLVYLDNASENRYFVQDVLLTGDFKDGQGNVVTSPNGLSVAGLAPNLFRVRNFPDGSFDAPNMIEGVFPGFPGPMRFDLGGYVFELSQVVTPPSGGAWYEFAGRMEVLISSKKSGAGPLNKVTVPLFSPVRMYLTP